VKEFKYERIRIGLRKNESVNKQLRKTFSKLNLMVFILIGSESDSENEMKTKFIKAI
jgi:hypothetical protein